MWRYPVLLLVASPLLYTAYDQGRSLFDRLFRGNALSETTLEEVENQIDDARKRTEKRGRPSIGLHRCLLQVEDSCPDVEANGSNFDVEVTDAARKHSKNLKDVSEVFIAYADIKSGRDSNPLDSGNPYHKSLQERMTLLSIEREMNKLVGELPQSKKKLETRLADYVSKRGDPRVVREITASLKRQDITGLATLPAEFKKALLTGSDQDRGTVREKIERVSNDLEQFLRKHGGAGEGDWARAELVHWKKASELLSLVAKGEGIASPKSAQGHLQAYAAFLKPAGRETALPEEIRSLANKMIRRFCDDYLRDLPLDDEVVIKHPSKESDSRTFKREKVEVVFQGKDLPAPLKVGEEFTLPQDKVRGYLVDGENFPRYRLEPTSRSRAVLFYNKHRAKLKWTIPSLESLLARTQEEKYKAELLDAAAKIESLLATVKEHPELFRAAD